MKVKKRVKKWSCLSLGGILLIALLYSYLLKPKQSYLTHAAFIKSLDYEYQPIQHKWSSKRLLRQKYELLPHLRPTYCRYACSAPEKIKRRVLLQQHTSDLSKLLSDAAQTQLRLSKFLKGFAENYPNSLVYIPNIKGMPTIRSLLQTRWDGDASMITDYARATISFPKLTTMYQGLEDLKKSGLIILQITDSFLTPCLGGYRDINVVFRDFSNGHLGEIQLNLNSIMNFKNGLGTAFFHVIRTLLAIPALENRPLSKNENICLDWLFEQERLGYEAALKKASE